MPFCKGTDRGANLALPERGLTSSGCLVTRQLDKPPKAGRQMTAGYGLAGAPADGTIVGEPQVGSVQFIDV